MLLEVKRIIPFRMTKYVMLIAFVSALTFLGYGWHCGRSIGNPKSPLWSQYNIQAENLIVFPEAQLAYGQGIAINDKNIPNSFKIDRFLLRPSFTGDSSAKFKIVNFQAEIGPYRIDTADIRSELNSADDNFIVKNMKALNVAICQRDGISLTMSEIKAGLLHFNYINDFLKGQASKEILSKIFKMNFSLQFIKFDKLRLNDAYDEAIAFLEKGSFSIKRYSGLTDITLSISAAPNPPKDKTRSLLSDLNGCWLKPLDCGYDFYFEMSEDLPSKFYVKLVQNRSFALSLRSKAPINNNFFSSISSQSLQQIFNDPLNCFANASFKDILIIELQNGSNLANKYLDEIIRMHNNAIEQISYRIPLNWALMASLLVWCGDNGISPSYNSSFILNFPQKTVSPFAPEFIKAINHNGIAIKYSDSIVDYRPLLD